MRSIMAMLRPKRADASELYGALVAEARRPGWYLAGGVPDDRDGRFAVLATVVAVAILRLEQGGEDTARHSVALTEAFIADMDAQLRQEGFGDPGLGKQVRATVGSLASRVDRWRRTLAGDGEWSDSVASSIYRDEPADEAARTFAGDSLRRLAESLGGASDAEVMAGHWK